MYRLSRPNIIFFTLFLVLGIFVVALTPHYLMQSRIISFGALFIGEVGLSFIPIIALFPKANMIQAIVLALIYFLTTLIICFAAWGINTFGWPGEYSFLIKNDEFHINTFSLFVSNFFSFIILITNYRLTYDEESAKKARTGAKEKKKGFFRINKPKLNRPHFEETEKPQGENTEKFKTKSKSSSEQTMDEDFWKPFDFEPEPSKTIENLPEESLGKLFAKRETETKHVEKGSEFFDDEAGINLEEPIYKPIEKPKPLQISPFPPSNIKDELAAIFEQYSSLDAVKKITSSRAEKLFSKKTEKETKKPYSLPNKSQISVKVDGEDIHEASFRQISEAEKIEEIKETLKKELEEEIKSKLIYESKETSKDTEPKENIIESIKNIKEELIESLKTEIKKEFAEPIAPIISDKELVALKQKLEEINKNDQIISSMYLNYNGNVLSENWNEEEKSLGVENTREKISQLFAEFNKQISKTKQGNLLHILLESKNGALIMANAEDKLLAIQTRGTGEVYIGQLLRKLSEIEG